MGELGEGLRKTSNKLNFAAGAGDHPDEKEQRADDRPCLRAAIRVARFPKRNKRPGLQKTRPKEATAVGQVLPPEPYWLMNKYINSFIN